MAKRRKKGAKSGSSGSPPTSNVANPEPWLVSLLGGGVTVSGIAVSPDRAMANPTVSACVQILSNDIAKLPLVMYQGSPRGDVRHEVTEHPAIQCLTYQPNDWMTPYDFWRFHQMNYLLEGNNYEVMFRNSRGELTSLVPIPRNRVSLYTAEDGELYYAVARGSTHEETELSKMPLLIPAQYVLHDRGPSRDGLTGLSVIGWHRESIGLALAGEDHASRTFSAGARPSGVLQHPKTLSDAARKRLKSEFEDYRGQPGALATILLEEGLNFNPVTMSNVDVQFIESRRFQVEEIARFFGIPHHKIGVPIQQLLDPERAEQNYVNSTLVHHLERIESLLDTRLLTTNERGKFFFEFDLTRLLRGDQKSRFESYAVGRQWGWLSVNDIRAAENLNPVPKGDGYLQPVNMVPLGTDPPKPQPPAGSTPSSPGTTAPGTQPPGADAPPKPKPGDPNAGKGRRRTNGHANPSSEAA